jgi:hypothetical protein
MWAHQKDGASKFFKTSSIQPSLWNRIHICFKCLLMKSFFTQNYFWSGTHLEWTFKQKKKQNIGMNFRAVPVLIHHINFSSIIRLQLYMTHIRLVTCYVCEALAYTYKSTFQKPPDVIGEMHKDEWKIF